MSQSNIVFLGMFIAFIVYVTMKGEFPTYLGIFGLGPVPSGCKPQTSTSTPVTGSTGSAATGSTTPGPTNILPQIPLPPVLP